MNTFRNILMLLIVVLVGLPALAQKYSTTNKIAIRLYEQSNGLAQARQFDKAKECLYEAIKKDPKFTEAYIRLAGIHNLFQDFDKARNALQKAVEVSPNDKDMAGAYLLLGELYMMNGSYDLAAENFQRVLTVQPNDQNMLTKAESRVKSAKFASNAVKNPIDMKAVKSEPAINNFHAQGYPLLTADNQTMMFYVLRTPDARGDIMISKKNAEGHWTHAVSLSENINTDGDEGAPTMSADGRSMVFAACQRAGTVGGCDLYISNREGEIWSEPINLGREVNSPSWDSEPSISADGRTLYFSSDRPVAKGRKDRNIWMTKKGADGKWSAAKPLPAPVNTTGHEVSPFVHVNNSTLYFASDYHPGMGGYDAFSTKRLNDSTWTEPVNLGYPLNTTDNDGTVFVTADGMKGYYSVYERNAKVNSASFIYEFDMPQSLKEENKSTYAKGIVTDKSTGKPLAASVELLDVASGELVQSVTSDRTDGSYLLILTEGKQYALRVYAKGYLFESRSFDFRKPTEFNPVALNFQLSPLKSGASVVLSNIFFPSNSANLQRESDAELGKVIEFLNLNTGVRIELSGHTDDVGSDADNLSLSERRAKSVYEYLTAKGVARDRLIFKGYGETKPKQPNSNEANRAANRRIEFKIL